MALQIRMNATGSVEDLLEEIKKRFSISHPYEYALQVVRKNEHIWLTTGVPLCEQLFDSDERVVLRRKVFLSDSQLDNPDPFEMEFLYLECRRSVVTGRHPITLQQAVQFAALQMQTQFGNYDPLVHVADYLKTKDFLPPNHQAVVLVEEDIYNQHRKLKGW